jgi:hypothetical protein
MKHTMTRNASGYLLASITVLLCNERYHEGRASVPGYY